MWKNIDVLLFNFNKYRTLIKFNNILFVVHQQEA